MTPSVHEGEATARLPIASTILIVEDETLVSFFIRTLCEERGLQVAVAETAAEALQLIEALGSQLGAALIDIGLPDTPGDQLIAPIRAVLPELPIVICTGVSEREFGRFQVDLRVRVIAKPFDAPLLWSVLGSLDDRFA